MITPLPAPRHSWAYKSLPVTKQSQEVEMTAPQREPRLALNIDDGYDEPEIPGCSAQQPAPQPMPRRARSASPPQRYVPRQMRLHIETVAPRRRSLVGNPAVFLPLLTFAICAGGMLGFVSANPDQLWASLYDEARPLAQPKPTQAQRVAQTVMKIPRSVMASGQSIQLKDTISRAAEAVPLVLKRPTEPDAAYHITGLPADAKLTAGVEIGLGEWMVKGADFSKLSVVLPEQQLADVSIKITNRDKRKAKTEELRITVPKSAASASKDGDRVTPSIGPVIAPPIAPPIAPMMARGNSGVAHDSKSDPDIIITPVAGPVPNPFAPNAVDPKQLRP
jgi:hypothetical protein